MISQQLLDILVCPDTRTPLRVADEALVSRLNAAVEAGTLKNASDETVDRKLENALVREDGTLVYPVLDGIPVLLSDQAIVLDQL